MKNIAIRLSVIMLSAVLIHGQSISPLTTPHSVQATGSTVVITATVSPPSSVILSGGNTTWIVRVARAGYAPYPTVATALDFSFTYSGRINVSAASSSALSFTTQLTIARLRAEEDGYQVELDDLNVTRQSIALTVRASVMISADPPYNPLATGFNNLLVTAQFPGYTDSSCSWFYGGELDGGSGAPFYFAVICDPPAPGTYDRITCNEQTINGTNHVTTTLKITQPLAAGRLDITMICIEATIPDCNSSLPFDVFVNTTSKTFNASGNFVCPNQGELFYSNGTMLTSNATTCRASAAWSGQIDLQCWSAPNVTLASILTEDGNLTVIEGNDVNLTCQYNDVIPAGNNSKFYVGDDHYFTTKASQTVTSLDHGAYVLIVQSLNTFYFPNTVSISFEIIVSGTSPDNPAASGLSTGAIVGISCGAAALILGVAAAYAYFKWRQAPNKKNNSAPTSTNMTSSRAIQDESDYIEPNKIENIPVSQEQYAEVDPSVDNAGYIDLNKEFNSGGLKQNKSLEGPYEEVKNL
ncbi:unnamed protein product [Clavelina lepadiformis]|uniref:Ig-like domain-containing protein n=1 Tax=Clavelina lepadiformis TaxID=159417 RepID=A0ABP0FFU5_CLALP